MTSSTETIDKVLKKAGTDALGGGIPGMIAMVAQVSTLMWLRTTINYQYRYGVTTTSAFKTLYRDGGIPRFYRGYSAAIVQGPLSRFGDTAANTGVFSLLNQYPMTKDMPIFIKTGFASITASGFRILLMPIDTIKTVMQVEGSKGIATLKDKMQTSGSKVLFHGAMAASVATLVGHYPWFATYNYLNHRIQVPNDPKEKLMRNAFIGFVSSIVSDTCSNSVRIVKTTRQTIHEDTSYTKIIKMILERDGWSGLFGRGLKTKIITNGVQGMLFSVYWKMGQDYLKK
uniref:Mitochondrial carrier protein n=1 Tax=viral metagenome TaxID=1070528 RepID=A0A6C0CTP4_9ZZZZ